MSCIELEIEGYYYVAEVEDSIKRKLVNSNLM